MKPYSFMTLNQKRKIDWICDTLGIEYSGSCSSVDAWKFINEYIEDAEITCEQMVLLDRFYSQF